MTVCSDQVVSDGAKVGGTRSRAKGVVFLPVEVKARDLEPRSYLGAVFAKAGFHVLIGRKATLTNLAKAQQSPVIWIDKGLDPKNLDFYRLIRRRGGLLFQLHEEGGIFQPDIEENMKNFRAFDPGIMEFCNGHFMWGERTAALIRDALPAYRERILAVGHPKFDLFRMFAQRGAKHKGGYLLISTSFVLGNPRDGDESFWPRFKKSLGDRYELFDWEEKRQHSVQIRLEFVQLVKSITEALPELKIRFRPHPAENHDLYREVFSGLSSVEISSSCSFRQDLKNAIALVHHDCSTGVEATVADVPVISFNPTGEMKHCQQIAVDISCVVRAVEEVVDLIRGIQVGDEQVLKRFESKRIEGIERLREYIASVDQECSGRIVDLVEQLMKSEDSSQWGCEPTRFNFPKRMKQWVVRNLIRDDAQYQKFPSLLPDEFDGLLREFHIPIAGTRQFERDVCLLEATL